MLDRRSPVVNSTRAPVATTNASLADSRGLTPSTADARDCDHGRRESWPQMYAGVSYSALAGVSIPVRSDQS
jgi:hypothetical protein